METIDLFEAIRQMRILSQEGRSFSMVHSTWNRDTCTSDGQRLVKRARLRPQAKGDEISQADHKLFYFDMDERQNRNCWQVLLMYFNGIRVTLN
ncbi:MAG: hypothetical protein NTU44_13525 [Bacteroidetes bacterium]|nr:hypothetical protein [Bacteroidota bacterium]